MLKLQKKIDLDHFSTLPNFKPPIDNKKDIVIGEFKLETAKSLRLDAYIALRAKTYVCNTDKKKEEKNFEKCSKIARRTTNFDEQYKCPNWDSSNKSKDFEENRDSYVTRN